jgi:rhamnosyltransferase subunit B
MGHILLLPHGTSGSVYPFIALGRILRGRGHRVTMVAAGAYTETAIRAGIDFASVGDTELDALLSDERLWTWHDGARVSYASAGRSTAGYVNAIEEIIASDGLPDLMLAPMINFGARLAREKHGVPLITVHLYPMMFVTASSVPLFGPEARALRRMPPWLRRGALRLPNPLDREALPAVRACCAQHGVDPPKSLWRQWWHSPDGVIALFPEWFAPPQPDWPHNLLQWDFTLEDLAAEQPLDPALRRFLGAGDRPIVFTAGTGQFHAASFFAEAAELVRRCGCRAVFVTRKLDQLPQGLPDAVFAASYVPFSALLPRAQALVHHGGIGTMAQALAAGVPQLVVAMSLDQPDNAERIERLGAGLGTSPTGFTAERALPPLQRCLRDERIRRAAAECATRMRARPSPETLARWLESRQVPSRRRDAASSVDRTSPRVIFIPGLGADSRTFRGPWDEIPNGVFVEWPEYHGEASITSVARFVTDAWRIPDGAVLVAPSFGGAIACEIAKVRAIRAIVLIASSGNPADYAGARKMRRLAKLVPLARIARFLRAREGIRRERYGRDPSPFMRALLDSIEQFSVSRIPFYLQMLDALESWQGLADSRVKVVRIHGRHDRTVRPPAGADLMLDGGHFIVLTHARDCVEFIKTTLRDSAIPPSECGGR